MISCVFQCTRSCFLMVRRSVTFSPEPPGMRLNRGRPWWRPFPSPTRLRSQLYCSCCATSAPSTPCCGAAGRLKAPLQVGRGFYLAGFPGGGPRMSSDVFLWTLKLRRQEPHQTPSSSKSAQSPAPAFLWPSHIRAPTPSLSVSIVVLFSDFQDCSDRSFFFCGDFFHFLVVEFDDEEHFCRLHSSKMFITGRLCVCSAGERMWSSADYLQNIWSWDVWCLFGRPHEEVCLVSTTF